MRTPSDPKTNAYDYQCEPENYCVVYLTDNADLYCDVFTHKEDVEKFLEQDIPDYKAIVIQGSKIEDRT